MKKNNSKQYREKKEPIAPVLKSMELYKTCSFPLTRASSVRATIQGIKTDIMNIDFTTKKNKEKKILEVTRIA